MSAGSLTLVPQNVNSSSYQLQSSATIGEGTYSYTASIFDNFNKSRLYERTTNVAPVPVFWYAYLSEVGAYATNLSTALNSYKGEVGIDDGTIVNNYPC